MIREFNRIVFFVSLHYVGKLIINIVQETLLHVSANKILTTKRNKDRYKIKIHPALVLHPS